MTSTMPRPTARPSDGDNADGGNSDETPISIRFLTAADAPRLVDAIHRSYGDTYDVAWLYDDTEIAHRLDSGTMRSLAGFVDDEIVGHVALLRASMSARVGEAGQAVVDPRFRSHHLFTTLKRSMADWCSATGVFGMYSEATAAHPYSQAANLSLGGHETGFLLGYIPASVSYTDISAADAARRQSVALFWLTTNAPPARTVHPPQWHRDIVGRIYRHNALDRVVGHVPRVGSLPEDTTTILAISERDDHNQAWIRIDQIGSNLLAAIEAHTARLAAAGRDVIYLDLRLEDPATAHLPLAIHDELGYFFGGVIPELNHGDVLRLQFLNDGVEADPTDVSVASTFGGELLDYVFARKTSARSV
jgi:hypothetical protein